MKITDKSQMYEMFDRGLFGNRPITYDSVEDYLTDSYEGTVSARYKDRSSGKSLYGLTKENVLLKLIEGNFNLSSISLSQSPPDDKIIFQGEVKLGLGHYEVTWSTVPKPMKLALADSINYSSGAAGAYLLRKYFNANSLSDLHDLFRLYPDSVIEFTCYSICLGTCRGRNTLIWEVRNY